MHVQLISCMYLKREFCFVIDTICLSALQPFCVCMYVGEYARVLHFVYVFEARVLLRNNHDLSECSAAVLCVCVCM